MNLGKSPTVHIRTKQRPRCNTDLILDGRVMEYVANYKYLGAGSMNMPTTRRQWNPWLP